MKPYIKNGHVIYDKNKPPTKKEWRQIQLRVYIENEIKLYSEILNILTPGGDRYKDTINYSVQRLRDLGEANIALLRNQPAEYAETIINAHYCELIQSYI